MSRIVCSLFLLSLTAPPALGEFIIHVNPAAAFHRTNQDPNAKDAVAIDLFALGIHDGDEILLTRIGTFVNQVGLPDAATGLVGVFSSTSTILDGSNLNRIPGAIDAGQDVVTGNTYYGNLSTDISQDFRISGDIGSTMNGITIQVPDTARFLFVDPADIFFSDNTDPDANFGLSITDLTAPPASVPEPSSIVMLAAGIAGLSWAAIAGKVRRFPWS